MKSVTLNDLIKSILHHISHMVHGVARIFARGALIDILLFSGLTNLKGVSLDGESLEGRSSSPANF